MQTPLMRPILLSQFQAALAMLRACVEACPDDRWDGPPIAKYPFWMVVYHTLCFVDCYLSPSDEAWRPHPDLHPAGRAELEEEYPSRRFEREELLRYADLCRENCGGFWARVRTPRATRRWRARRASRGCPSAARNSTSTTSGTCSTTRGNSRRSCGVQVSRRGG